VVVPTYNEAGNIDELVRRIQQSCSSSGVDAEVVIVDDNSPDGTGARAEELAKDHQMKVVHRAGKLGLSSAVLEGFAAAAGDVLVVMDADLSHPPEKIPEMFSRIESGEAEIVFGSRYVPGGSVEEWPFHRKIISKGATLFARGLTKVKDPMSGFFMLKRSVLDGADLDPIGFKIGLEILVKGKYSKVVEVPIHFANRKAGKSKLGTGEYLKYLDHAILLYEHKRFWLSKYLKFSFIGGIGALINIAVLWFLVEAAGVYYLTAAVVSFAVAATSNFVFNRIWTFRSKSEITSQYVRFLVVSVDGLFLNLILLKQLNEEVMPAIGVTSDKASLFLIVSQLIAIIFVSVFNFVANSFWTYSDDIKTRKRRT
jgi:dolichol-phosphate mannosyltransferase